ncbi:MAG: hypothetical protein HY253_11295, partial [Burkholderiales bacterium]|nr:hypothetical protein [Burkholderiales bacterium]
MKLFNNAAHRADDRSTPHSTHNLARTHEKAFTFADPRKHFSRYLRRLSLCALLPFAALVAGNADAVERKLPRMIRNQEHSAGRHVLDAVRFTAKVT